MSNSLADGNLYTMLLLYGQGNCASVPGGCPPDRAMNEVLRSMGKVVEGGHRLGYSILPW